MPGGPAVLRFSRGLPPSKQYGERLRLLVRQGQDQGTCFSLLGDLVFIGREDCQIVFNDSNISRKHAEISWKNDHYIIRDLGSANGVVYNGTKVNETKLKPGDILLIGLTVVEVYPPGQTRKNDRPMLAAPLKRTGELPAAAAAGPAGAPVSATGGAKILNKKELEERRKVDRKRMLIFVVLFFLVAIAYFNDEGATMRSHTKIQQVEDEPDAAAKSKNGKPVDNSIKKIEAVTKQIQETKMRLVKFQEEKSRLEERAKTMKNLSAEALQDTMNNVGDKAQRRDADLFFRNGVRELQNRNFRRAFTSFDTALTVDPSHELAKIYLKSAKMELLSELWNTQVAGLRAKAALRYKDARMNFENIIRYLENESVSNGSMENEANKELRELHDEAKKELAELDQLENRGK